MNEITIENLCDFSVKSIKTFDQYIDLFVLSENQNIINNRGNIFLYDNSFKSPKSKKVSDEIFNIKEFFKVDSNTFIYSSEITYKTIDIYIANIIDNNISIKHTINCGEELIYFSEKKKIIFSMDFRYIYLINFNFEIIQKIEIKDLNDDDPYSKKFFNYTELIRNLTSFNDDSIYLEFIFSDCSFLIQYKIIEGEFIEVSRIKIKLL